MIILSATKVKEYILHGSRVALMNRRHEANEWADWLSLLGLASDLRGNKIKDFDAKQIGIQ